MVAVSDEFPLESARAELERKRAQKAEAVEQQRKERALQRAIRAFRKGR